MEEELGEIEIRRDINEEQAEILDKDIRSQGAKEEQMNGKNDQDEKGGEKKELADRAKQVLKSKFSSKFSNDRGPYCSSTRGRSQGGSSSRRAPGMKKVTDPKTRDIKTFFSKLGTRQEEVSGPKSLVSLIGDLEARNLIRMVGPKGGSSGGIKREVPVQSPMDVPTRQEESLDKDCVLSDN